MFSRSNLGIQGRVRATNSVPCSLCADLYSCLMLEQFADLYLVGTTSGMWGFEGGRVLAYARDKGDVNEQKL
jgi:hypothetical protein